MIPVLLRSTGGSESPWVHRQNTTVIRITGMREIDRLYILMYFPMEEDTGYIDDMELDVVEDGDYKIREGIEKIKVHHLEYDKDSLVNVDLINGT